MYLLKDNGPLEFEEILNLIEDKYSTFRKPNGKLYDSDIRKSLKGALSANGIFYPIS